jgi:hypothetical protein
VIAVVAPVLAASVKVLKLPSAVVEIVAGIIVGPSVLARVKVDQPVTVVPLLGLAGRDRADPGDRVLDVLDRRGVGAGHAELMLGLTRREEPAGDRLIAGTQTLAENAPSRCTRRACWWSCVLRYLAVFLPVPTTIRRITGMRT